MQAVVAQERTGAPRVAEARILVVDDEPNIVDC